MAPKIYSKISIMNEKMTHAQAKAAGFHKFFPLQPCKRGHTGMRYTATNSCIACVRGYGRRYHRAPVIKSFIVEAHTDDIAAIVQFAEDLLKLRGLKNS